MILHVIEQVALWLADGVPARLVWRGVRWRVTDAPTPLTETVYLAHPISRRIGWRFQATNDAGEARVFDVRAEGASWSLVAVYD